METKNVENKKNDENKEDDFLLENTVYKKLDKQISQYYLFNYFLDVNQYDGRCLKILNYFYLNNEPLFYLAFSYCSKFRFN